MSRAARYRFAFVAAGILLFELLCRIGVIDRLTMQPPSAMVRDLVVLLASGSMNQAMLKTFTNVAIACAASIACMNVHGPSARRRSTSRRIGFESDSRVVCASAATIDARTVMAPVALILAGL